MARKISRRQLEELWENATEMPCDDGLNGAIVEEAWCGGDDDAQAIYNRLIAVAQDAENFAQAIAEYALLSERAS